MKVNGLTPSEMKHRGIKRVLRDHRHKNFDFTVTFSKWKKIQKGGKYRHQRARWERTLEFLDEKYVIKGGPTFYTAYVNGYSNWEGTKQVPTYSLKMTHVDNKYDGKTNTHHVWDGSDETRIECIVALLWHVAHLYRRKIRKEEE